MPTMCRALLLALLTLPVAGAPEIAYVTEPACQGEVVVITGEGFRPGQTRVKAVCLGAYSPAPPPAPVSPLPDLPTQPTAQARDCPVLGAGAGFLQVDLRCLPHAWVQAPVVTALWVGDETAWSAPYLLNRPQAHWLYPRTQSPGEPLRVFGRTFAWGHQLPAATAWVRRSGTTALTPLRGAAQHHEDGHTERWSLSAWLPADLAPGEYEVLVHGRHGGVWGWSDPLPLTVAARRAPRPVVNVRDLGARGDGLTDDTAALEAALKRAAPGGTVLLPPGVYPLTHTLELPADVVLQGASLGQTVVTNRPAPALEPWTLSVARSGFVGRDLVHGLTRFGLRDLTLRFAPAHGSALRVGQDPQWSEDVSFYNVRFESQQDFGLALNHPYCERPVNIVKARRLAMVRCETYGPGAVSCERKVEDSLFAQNQFVTDRRWRGHGFKFWGVEHTVFEDNRLTGDDRGLVLQTHFGVNFQNLIAGNSVERTVLGGNAGETYLVEGAGLLYESRVERADGLALRTARWPQVRGRAAGASDCVGRFVVVARGRGLGQWRRIAGCDPAQRELRVDRAWRLAPDASSVVVVMNGLIQTVFVNNQEVDCGKGLYIYGAGALDNIVDRHLCDRTLGVTLMTNDDRQSADPAQRETAPDFFNLVRDCRIHGGGGLLCAAGGRLPLEAEPDAPLANFANRFVSNEVQDVRPFSGAQYGPNWTWGGGWDNRLAGLNLIPMDLGRQPGTGVDGPPRLLGNVFAGNWVCGARVGCAVSRRAARTLLWRNVFDEVGRPLVDLAQDTRNLEPSGRGDDSYSPERGPIR